MWDVYDGVFKHNLLMLHKMYTSLIFHKENEPKNEEYKLFQKDGPAKRFNGSSDPNSITQEFLKNYQILNIFWVDQKGKWGK